MFDTGGEEVKYKARTLCCFCSRCLSSRHLSSSSCGSSPWVAERAGGAFEKQKVLSTSATWEEVEKADVDLLRGFAVEKGWYKKEEAQGTSKSMLLNVIQYHFDHDAGVENEREAGCESPQADEHEDDTRVASFQGR